MLRHIQSHHLSEQGCDVTPDGVNTSLRRVAPHLVFTRSQGAIITDADGNDYIDYQAAFGPIVLGHNFAGVNRRVQEAMERIDLVGTGTAGGNCRASADMCHSGWIRIDLCNLFYGRANSQLLGLIAKRSGAFHNVSPKASGTWDL